ncbi:MAG: toprim domain-containing protein, partial [Proteobacteria bacterium]|nr:toprim domain-containing protein [Candidatus Enterousia avistercoris]
PLGTALTEDHVSMLCKANRNITFCFDGDAAGQKAAARACDIVMSFLRDTSDIRFAFVSGGKDPDEILKKSGAAAMHKIIDNSVALVDFLWNLVNAGFTVSTPNGRTQAEKFLKHKIEKITDTALRGEYEHEYNSRMFNEWHKWKKNKNNAHEINLPQVDTITQNTLIFITDKYPDIAERYADFLATLNISLDGDVGDMNLDRGAAEKYIVSLKLQRYLEKLNAEKRDLTAQLLSGADVAGKIAEIDEKSRDANEKLEKLISM